MERGNAADNGGREKQRVQALDRVLTRLALTTNDGSSLQKILDKLLPAVIAELDENEVVSRKVIEILSHVNKVVCSQEGIAIPTGSLVKLLHNERTSLKARSFAFVYIEKGFMREEADKQLLLVPEILEGLSSFRSSDQHAQFRLAVVGLQNFSTSKLTQVGLSLEDFLKREEDKHCFIDFVRKFMLYQKPYNTQNENISPGLSLDLMQSLRIQDETYENTVQRKLALLNFLTEAGFSIDRSLDIFIIAACDPNEAVSGKGDRLLRQKCAIQNVKPLVDLESTEVINKLYSLFHGSVEENTPENLRQTPASLTLRLKILSCFIRSVKAANLFPWNVKTVFECLFSPTSNQRMRLAGMEFTVWVLQHASHEQLVLIGPIVLKGMLKFLNEEDRGDRNVVKSRQFCYDSIAELGKRLPQIFSKDEGILSELLRVIGTEEEQVKAGAIESMRLLARAYSKANGQVKWKLENIVMGMIASDDEVFRLLAIQWSNTIYDPKDYHGLYIAIYSTGDESLQVAEEGRNVLKKWEKSLGKYAEEGIVSSQGFVEYISQRNPKWKNVCLRNAIRTIRHIRKGELGRSDDANLGYMGLISSAFEVDDSDIALEAISTLLVEAAVDPDALASCFLEKKMSLKKFLSSPSKAIRQGSAVLCGIIFSNALKTEPELMDALVSEIDRVDPKRSTERFHGLLLAVGRTIAHSLLNDSVADGIDIGLVGRFYEVLKQQLDSSNQLRSLAIAAASAVGKIAICVPDNEQKRASLKAHSDLFEANAECFCDSLRKLSQSTNADVSSAASIALGHVGASRTAHSEGIASFLLGLIVKVKEESQLALGESLCILCGSLPISVFHLVLSDWTLNHNQKGIIPTAHRKIDTEDELKISQDQRGICDRILEELLSQCCHSQPKVRRSASVALSLLVQNTRGHPSVLSRLLQLQRAFCELLKDTDPVTQEMASQGISFTYKMSTGETRTELVEALMDSLTSSKVGPKKQKFSADTEIDVDIIGKDPEGQRVTTYKHLCSLATDIGQPDIIYRFISLFNHNALMSSIQGAASSLSLIAADEAADGNSFEVSTHLKRIIPKLYRLLYEPSIGVQESMRALWCSLLDDPVATVDENFSEIMEELLREMTVPSWQNRQSSSAAMADLIQGRQWHELSKYFQRIWENTFRVVDDIKETVRNAGVTLANSLQRVTMRLCENADTAMDENGGPADIAFGILLDKGVISPVKEVKYLSLGVLYKLVKFCDRELLSQHLAHLVHCLIECLSGLEDSTFNYVEQHAGRVGIDKDNLDSLRISAANSSVVGDMLDRLTTCVDETNLEEVSSKLCGILKHGIGTATCAGAAKFLTSVVIRIRHQIRPMCPMILRALSISMQKTMNHSVRRAYAASFAQVVKFADLETKQVNSLIVGIADSVHEDIDNGTTRHVASSAMFILEICRQAPDVFAEYKSRFLPLAFCMKYLKDSNKSETWSQIWDEGAPTNSTVVRMYHQDIGYLCLKFLQSDKWDTRRGGSAAIKELVSIGGDFQLTNVASLFDGLVKLLLPGRYWTGKEEVLEALALLCSKHMEGVLGANSEADVLAPISVCIKSKKRTMQRSAISALAKVIPLLKDRNALSPFAHPVIQIFERKEEEDKANQEMIDLMAESLAVLSVLWTVMPIGAVQAVADPIVQTLSNSLSGGVHWTVRNASATAISEILKSEVARQVMTAKPLLELLVQSVTQAMHAERRERALSLLLGVIETLFKGGYRELIPAVGISSLKDSLETKLQGELSPGLQMQASQVLALVSS